MSVDGFLVASSTDVFPRPIAEQIAAGIADQTSLHSLLEEAGYDPRRGEVTVSIDVPPTPHRERLGNAPAAAPTWRVVSETVDHSTGQVVHRSTSWMRTDVFAISVVVEAETRVR